MATSPDHVTDPHFSRQKQKCLEGKVDISRKGSIDGPIRDLVDYINDREGYYTTSSCSGRILLYSEGSDVRKRGCQWLLVSHDHVTLSQLTDVLHNKSGVRNGYTYFKFEPFVLHISCSSIPLARTMLQIAVSSGFRNSGLSISKNQRIILAIRSTHSLQAPVSFQGELLVTTEYMNHLVHLANEKMTENLARISKFFQQVQQFGQTNTDKQDKSPVRTEKPKQKLSADIEQEELEYTDYIGDLFTTISS